MALTLESEQRLERVNLIEFFTDDEDVWLDIAKETYEFIESNFPDDSKIRRDDVAKALVPILEVHEDFRDELNEKKLRQKFWIKDFADLIIDRTWHEISGEEEEEDED